MTLPSVANLVRKKHVTAYSLPFQTVRGKRHFLPTQVIMVNKFGLILFTYLTNLSKTDTLKKSLAFPFLLFYNHSFTDHYEVYVNNISASPLQLRGYYENVFQNDVIT